MLALFFATQVAVAIKIVVPDQYQDQIEAIKEAERQQRESELQGVSEANDGEGTMAIESSTKAPEVDADEFLVQSVVEATDTATEFEGTLAAGEGLVSGQVVNKETGEPVSGVAIIIEGTDVATVTDGAGRYSLGPATAGLYTISFIKSGYIEANVTEYTVAGGEVSVFPFAMPPRPAEMSDEVYELQDFTVTAEEAINQTVALLDLRQNSIASINALSAEDFSKFAAGDVAEAVSKISGASLSDGKYVVVRGLNDRYNTVLINGVRLPSPDPDRKAIALDIFPTSLIESILARKTYTTDMPGESSGGSIDLITKSVPEEFFAKLSFSVGGQLTSSDTDTFLLDPEQVSLTDWLKGNDPRGFGVSAQGSILLNNYPNAVGSQTFPLFTPISKDLSALSDRSYSLSFGTSEVVTDWLTVGGIFGAKVSEKSRSKYKEINSVKFEQGQAVVDKLALRTDRQGVLEGEQEYASSFLVGLGAKLFERHELNYNFIYTDTLTSTATQADYRQYVRDAGSVNNTPVQDGFNNFTDVELASEEKSLTVHQFSGEHRVDAFDLDNWKFSWYFTDARTEQSEPDQRFIKEYYTDLDGFSSNPDFAPVSRFQRDTEQASQMYGFGMEQSFELTSDITLNLAIGYDSENSEREFEQLETVRDANEQFAGSPTFFAMPFPDGAGTGVDPYYAEDFFGIDLFLDALYSNQIDVVLPGQIASATTAKNNSITARDSAQANVNTIQSQLDVLIPIFGADDPIFVAPLLADLAVAEASLSTAESSLFTADAALAAANGDLAQAISERDSYDFAAAALFTQIASMPSLATDPTAFPSYNFLGDDGYILDTPLGFAMYGTRTAETAPRFDTVPFLTSAVGENKVSSFYMSGDLEFRELTVAEKVRVAGGFRRESTQLSYNARPDRTGTNQPSTGSSAASGFAPGVVQASEIDQTDYAYYLSMIVDINKYAKLSFSRSTTIAKPTFREIAPFPVLNLTDNSVEIGNGGRTVLNTEAVDPVYLVPDEFAGLDIADVINEDVRIEFFTPLDGLISFGYFRKQIKNPIERVFATSLNGNVDVNTFINNNEEADMDGWEFELQQNLGFLDEYTQWFPLPMSWLTIGGNYTKINAEVERSSMEKANLTQTRFGGQLLDPQIFQTGALSKRQLYDQPEFVANAFVTLDIEPTRTKITLSNNWLGKQLDRAGGISDNQKGSADFLFDEFSSLSLVVEQELTDHISLKFSVKNLNNPDRILYEDPSFLRALADQSIYDGIGGSPYSNNGTPAFRERVSVEPTYSISISGTF